MSKFDDKLMNKIIGIIHIIEMKSIYKWSLLMSRQIHILALKSKIMIKILKLKLMIMWEYPNTKNIFTKGYTPRSQVFVIKEVKNTIPWTYVISDLKGEEIVWMSYEKELEKTNQTEFRVKKVIKKKEKCWQSIC